MVAQSLARYSARSSYTLYDSLHFLEYAAYGVLTTSQGFFVFCGFQALLHMRESRRGAITLS
jgi:hypothetical protein